MNTLEALATKRTAFVFPGQGSQSVGMGRTLCERSSAARAVFEEADDILGFPLSRLCFEGPEADLTLTANTQPALLTVSVAIDRLLSSQCLRPAFVAGHSLGEYSALVAAGVLTFADALRAVRLRGEAMQEAVPPGAGAMAALLGLGPEGAVEACRESAGADVVSPANYNSPEQTVIAGHAAAVARACERALALGARKAVMLAVSAPFHCALMKPAETRLAAHLASVTFRDPMVPVVVNADAAPIATGEAARDALVRQVCSPVRWADSVRCLLDLGAEMLLEVGPGKVLTGIIRKIDRAVPAAATDDESLLGLLLQEEGAARRSAQ